MPVNYQENMELERELVMEEPYVRVYYLPAIKLGKVVWSGSPANLAEYKKPFVFLLNYAATHRVHYFMSDITNQGVVGPENRKWFEREAIPAGIKAGLKASAIILNDANVFKRYYINAILAINNKTGNPARIFATSLPRWNG